MIVLIASGNAPMLGWSPWIPARTLTATVAAELGETAFHGQHFRMLFVVGTLLFALSLGVNLLAALIFGRLVAPEEGRR
jgi:phosphate transport system permease protein